MRFCINAEGESRMGFIALGKELYTRDFYEAARVAKDYKQNGFNGHPLQNVSLYCTNNGGIPVEIDIRNPPAWVLYTSEWYSRLGRYNE